MFNCEWKIMEENIANEDNIERITNKLARKKQVKETIPPHGKLKIEKPLPFMLVYRFSTQENKQVLKLLLGEISYLIISSEAYQQQNISQLLQAIAKNLAKTFGSFIVIELWIGKPGSNSFKIKAAKDKAPATINALKSGLQELKSRFPNIETVLEYTHDRNAEGQIPLLSQEQYKEAGCLLVGLEIPPIFKNDLTNEFYPVYFRTLKTHLSKILRKTVFEFMRVQTSSPIESYHLLGSSKLQNAVWHVDKKLAEIEATFQFLLLVSPINTNEARQLFIKNKFKKNPEFQYRLLPIDPDYLKEKLYKINISKIDDPTLAFLFRDKREELEKQITMLRERGTKDFMYSSMRLYKTVDTPLLNAAKGILQKFVPTHQVVQEWADCHALAESARREIDWYREFHPQLDARVEIKSDVIGLLVSKGQLYIGETFKTPLDRVDALIHHEVGTHVLTFYNGKAQPLQQLSSGFADYDELQEGLAVLAEYLVGGLTKERLRLLAARVIAAHSLIEGGDFIETFRELNLNYEFDEETSFDVAARIHQGGGYTKDIIYLRGLIRLLEYLKSGGELEPLFVGKIAEKHIPTMEELRLRKVLNRVPLSPRYLKNKNALLRLTKVKNGISLTELID